MELVIAPSGIVPPAVLQSIEVTTVVINAVSVFVGMPTVAMQQSSRFRCWDDVCASVVDGLPPLLGVPNRAPTWSVGLGVLSWSHRAEHCAVHGGCARPVAVQRRVCILQAQHLARRLQCDSPPERAVSAVFHINAADDNMLRGHAKVVRRRRGLVCRSVRSCGAGRRALGSVVALRLELPQCPDR